MAARKRKKGAPFVPLNFAKFLRALTPPVATSVYILLHFKNITSHTLLLDFKMIESFHYFITQLTHPTHVYTYCLSYKTPSGAASGLK